MPLDPKVINAVGQEWEKAVAKHIERKLRVTCLRLDLGTPATKNCPDFRLDDPATGKPIALLEAKTVLSAGYDQKRSAHISTLDPALADSFPEYDPDENLDSLNERDVLERVIVAPAVSPNYEMAIADARRKYERTSGDRPELAGLPLLVAFRGDWWAPSHFLDRRQAPEISGFLFLEVDREREAALQQEPIQKLDRRLTTNDLGRLPPPAKEWRLVRNPNAASAVPDQIAIHCLDGYPGDPE